MFADKCRTMRVWTCTWPPRPSTRLGPGCGPTRTPSSPSTRQSSSSCSRPAPSQATPAVSGGYSPYILTSILHRSTGDYKDLCLPNGEGSVSILMWRRGDNLFMLTSQSIFQIDVVSMSKLRNASEGPKFGPTHNNLHSCSSPPLHSRGERRQKSHHWNSKSQANSILVPLTFRIVYVGRNLSFGRKISLVTIYIQHWTSWLWFFWSFLYIQNGNCPARSFEDKNTLIYPTAILLHSQTNIIQFL